MNILTRNNIKFDWDLAYCGLEKKWLTPIEVADAAYQKCFKQEIDENIIIELEIRKENRDEFIEFIHSLVTSDDRCVRAINIWHLAFLLDIISSKQGIKGKLEEVAVLWADLDHPPKWSDFIYYLPSKDARDEGDTFLYRNLLEYVSQEKAKIESEWYLS